MKKYSFFSIKTQFENLGDALINIELIRLARRDSITVIDLSRCEATFAQSIRNGADEARFTKGFLGLLATMVSLRARRNECYYFLSPGGYFGGLPPKEVPSRLLNTLVIALMRAIGVKVVLAGFSAERLSPASLFMFRLRRPFIHRMLVRDSLSQRYLESNRVQIDGIMPDLAFNIFGQGDPDGDSKLPEKRGVAISLRTDQHSDSKDRARRFVDRMATTVAADTPVVFYSQVMRDDAFMRELSLSKAWTAHSNVRFVSEYRSVDQARAQLSGIKLVVSNRLHVLLTAATVGARIAPVADGEVNSKLTGLFADLDVPISSLDSTFDSGMTGSDIQRSGVELSEVLRNRFKEIYGQ